MHFYPIQPYWKSNNHYFYRKKWCNPTFSIFRIDCEMLIEWEIFRCVFICSSFGRVVENQHQKYHLFQLKIGFTLQLTRECIFTREQIMKFDWIFHFNGKQHTKQIDVKSHINKINYFFSVHFTKCCSCSIFLAKISILNSTYPKRWGSVTSLNIFKIAFDICVSWNNNGIYLIKKK